MKQATKVSVAFRRLGVVLSPDGSPQESEGVLNPACTRARDGGLVLLPRVVGPGNVSHIARFTARWNGDAVAFDTAGVALEPEAEYEHRSGPGGYGCEDPRVTFIPKLDAYYMTYTAYGPSGPRVAIATSKDATSWERLGLVDFHGWCGFSDKDAALFPDVVTSPSGVPSFAILHRPMLHESAARGRDMVPAHLAQPPSTRESIRIAFAPAEDVLRDRCALLDMREVACVMQPDGPWGNVKVGTGTPPIRTERGWLFLYHGVDIAPGSRDSDHPALEYRAGIALLDSDFPNILTYRSPEPLFRPETPEELRGVVDRVVFPTGIDPRADLGPGIFDVYYGMGDYVCGRGRLQLTS